MACATSTTRIDTARERARFVRSARSSGRQAVRRAEDTRSLAKALINHPDVLLLDEPTASLDPDTADWVRGRLENYRDDHGMTILMASHNMAEVERMCERVIMMKKGVIVDDDTPAKLLARYGRTNLEEVFLDVARGTGVPTKRARPHNERCRLPRTIRRCFIRPSRGRASSRWCCAIGICCARRGRGVLDLIYWPTVQMCMWGLLQIYIGQQTGGRRAPARHFSAR